MGNRIGIALAIFLSIGISNPARGLSATYTFWAIDGSGASDLRDLDHYSIYLWSFAWNLPAGQTITGAKLYFNNIYDWTHETDRLSIFLLDDITREPGWTNIANGSTTTYQKADYQSTASVNWPTNQKTLVGTWTDPYGDSSHKANLVFDFGTLGLLGALNSYVANNSLPNYGNFGFGIDPDCHYYNDGIKFEIQTSSVPVPESSTMLLLGSGLAGLVGYGRKRFKK